LAALEVLEVSLRLREVGNLAISAERVTRALEDIHSTSLNIQVISDPEVSCGTSPVSCGISPVSLWNIS
jgi:hypothetical protein